MIGSPSGSESLPNTPGAATFNDTSSSVAYESATATGGSLIGLTVMVTVTVFESEAPSLALYRKESDPLNPAVGV